MARQEFDDSCQQKINIGLQNELTGHLNTRWAGQPVCVYDTIDSTNTECFRLAAEGAGHGTVVTAEEQTAGKGRRGRVWESPEGNNLYFSLLLRPTFAADKAPMLTLLIAMAVAEGVRRTTGLTLKIKWPNDLVLNGRKVCGILTEMRIVQKDTHTDKAAASNAPVVVIGVGVNVGYRTFPEELAAKATTLETVTGPKISRGVLLESILGAFEELYEEFIRTEDLSGCMEQYNALLVNLNREVTVLDPKGEYSGVARGINATGELLVQRSDGTVTEVFAGEVSVRGIYGYV